MALALASTAPLKPEIRLAQAVSEFEASLSGDQKSRFRLSRSQAQFLPPQINDVMRITAEVDADASRKREGGRCYGPRFTYLLQAVQQFAALGDIIVGGSQNLVACGVWSLVRMTILAMITSTASMERLSALFMSIGRSSPRYQALSVLYPRSLRIQDLLTRYFTVVVDICHHFVIFNNKSTFGQIVSSLDDSRLKSAEEELHRWAQSIKDEVDFLQAETTEREARQNKDFRSWVGATKRSTIHCQKIEKRIHRLSFFSSFDYETPWKQIRKRGSASFSLSSASYVEWKAERKPGTLLLTGKMGSGKSVIMANVVDDLHISQPNRLVLYFFCRRDNPDSLVARAIFSSLTRQVLQRHINSDTMDDIFEDFLQVPDFDKITNVLTTVLQRQNKTHQVHIVLDGFDECGDDEIELIKFGLMQVQSFCKIIISIRSRVNDPTTPRLEWDYSEMSISENNPDIEEFINAELSRRLQSGTLSLGCAELVIDIRDALLRGARGMFLWVVLQIECICAEQTDDSIRKALLNLPKDLSSTFRFILQKSKQPGIPFQRNILKMLVGANRPLMADELREALSVAPYEPSRVPEKMINNIYNTLKCCGSLVLIDEEELTVRLIHQSVAQFLIEANEEPHEWAFTPQEADHYIGEVAVTYLNYSSFEQRLSTKVASSIPVGDTPTKIMKTALQPYGLVGQLALAYLQPNTRTNQDIGKVLSEASSQYRRKYAMKESFKFLSYASDNWLYHTRWISPSSDLYSLWQRLLNNPRFATPPWGPNDPRPDEIVYDAQDDELQYMWRLSGHVTWSIFYSHLPLLSTALRGRNGIKAVCSIMPYLISLQNTNVYPKFSQEMGELLLRVATMFRASLVTDWLLRILRCTMDDYCRIIRNVGLAEYDTVRWMIYRPSLVRLETTTEPLVEIACTNHDAQTVRSLIHRGVNPDLYQTQHPLAILSQSLVQREDSLLMLYYLRHRCVLFPLTTSDLYFFLHKLCHTANLEFFNTPTLRSNIMPDSWRFPSVLNKYLHHVCLRGDYGMAKMLLNYGSWSDKKMSLNDLLLAALHSRSPVRHELVQLLVESNLGSSIRCFTDILIRCVQLRDWASANYLVNKGFKVKNFPHRAQIILNLCMDSDDADGVAFLVDHIGPSPTSLPAKYPTHRQFFLSDTTPLDIVLAKDITNLEVLCKAIALITPLARIARPGPVTDRVTGIAISWCREILRTYFLSETQPLDLIEASPNYTIEFVRDFNFKIEAVQLLGQLFKTIRSLHSERHSLLNILVDILRVYSAGVFAIWNMHHAILDGSPASMARDTILKSNCLKLEVTKLAKIILDIHMPYGKDEKEAQSISKYITAHLVMPSRHLEGVMEYLLQWYGITVFGFGLGPVVRDPVQELYSDPLVEAGTLGEDFKRQLCAVD